MKIIKSPSGESILIDDEDFERISKFSWSVSKRINGEISSVRRNVYSGLDRIIITIANEVMQNYNNVFDHKDINPLNNQKNNLRLCIGGQNLANRTKFKNCSSKYKGVSWYKRHNKWTARLSYLKRNIFLGYFNNELEAALAYDVKAREMFGEFANCNFK